MRLMTRIFLVFLLCLGTRVALAAANDGAVGIVLDLKGSGEVVTGNRTAKLQLLSYLQPQSQIKLAAGSKASVSLYATRSVYQLSGPAVVEVTRDKLNVLQGEAPQIKSMSEKLVAAAETSNLLPGAFRMRGVVPPIKLVSPPKGSSVFEGNPTLAWESDEDANFDVSVAQASGQVIYQGKTKANSLELPASVKLQPGQKYFWTVSYPTADGKQVAESGDFAVASKAEMDNLSALKPAANASIEEWILYAATLQSRQYNEEARKVWRMVAQQRPDLAKVQELAR